MKYKIFVSSVKREFEDERKFIKQEIENDYILNRFFEVFLFEELSSSGTAPEDLFSEEASDSDIYIGLIGSNYGSILDSGISPTEHEYNLYTKTHHDALIYIKNVSFRDEKTEQFIKKVRKHSYSRFDDRYELIKLIKESLGDFINKNLKNYRAFDSEILSNSSCDDVDPDAINLFFNVSEHKSLEDVKNDKGLTQLLATIKAGDYENDEFKLNNAGALFFAKDIRKFNLFHQVKMARFFDDDGVKTFDKLELNKNLLKLLEEAELFFYKTLRNISEVKGFKRETTYDYPFEAIREALVNALAHRDYTITSSPITFYIYNDRIEITSPGRLMYPLTIDNLEENRTVHRNELIANIFSKTKYMEELGTGIKRMKTTMREYGLDEPEFIEDGEFFKVIFRSNTKEKMFNSRQNNLIKSDKSKITIIEYMDSFNISRNTATKDLNELTKKGILEKVKEGKTIIYKKK